MILDPKALEAAKAAARGASGCGLTIDGQYCYCDDTRAEPKIRRTCDCGEVARAIVTAYLSARPAAEPVGWQPIETAPKNGTSILICGGGCYYTGVMDGDPTPYPFVNIACWYRDAWDGGYDSKNKARCIHVPTHWMPLPPVKP